MLIYNIISYGDVMKKLLESKLFSYYKEKSSHDLVLSFLDSVKKWLTDGPVESDENKKDEEPEEMTYNAAKSEAKKRIKKYEWVISKMRDTNFTESINAVDEYVEMLITRFESTSLNTSWTIEGKLSRWLIDQLTNIINLYTSIDSSKMDIEQILENINDVDIIKQGHLYKILNENIDMLFNKREIAEAKSMILDHDYIKVEGAENLISLISKFTGESKEKIKMNFKTPAEQSNKLVEIESEIFDNFLSKMFKNVLDMNPASKKEKSKTDYIGWVNKLLDQVEDEGVPSGLKDVNFLFISEVTNWFSTAFNAILKKLKEGLSDEGVIRSIQDWIFDIEGGIQQSLRGGDEDRIEIIKDVIKAKIRDRVREVIDIFNNPAGDKFNLSMIRPILKNLISDIDSILMNDIKRHKLMMIETIRQINKLVKLDKDDADHIGSLQNLYTIFADLDARLYKMQEYCAAHADADDAREYLEYGMSDVNNIASRMLLVWKDFLDNVEKTPSVTVDVDKMTTHDSLRTVWRRTVKADEFTKVNRAEIDAWFSNSLSLLITIMKGDEIDHFNKFLKFWHLINSNRSKYALMYVEDWDDWIELDSKDRSKEYTMFLEEIRSRCNFMILNLNDAIRLIDNRFKPYQPVDQWSEKYIKDRLAKKELNAEWKEHLKDERTEFSRVEIEVGKLISAGLLDAKVLFKVASLFSNLLNKTVGGLYFSSDVYNLLNEMVLSNNHLVPGFVNMNLIATIKDPKEFEKWYPGLNRLFSVLGVKFRFGVKLTVTHFKHIVGKMLNELTKYPTGSFARNNIISDLYKLEKELFDKWFVKYKEITVSWNRFQTDAVEFNGELSNDELWLLNELKKELGLYWKVDSDKLVHPAVRKAVEDFLD